MKTKIFVLILGMLCLCNMAFGQTVSPALSGFNGKIQFNGFANNGLFIRGTLAEFLDQTNQYFASDIDTNDVAWDNLGRKYRVVAVISSNLTQAVVDMARVGGGTHLPSGVGMVNRETANGLSLVSTANSIGISQQLLSRILTNNFEVMGGMNTIYTGSDSVRVPQILVRLDANANQIMAFGNFPDFPSLAYSAQEYGLIFSPDLSGSHYLRNGNFYLEMGKDLSIIAMFSFDGIGTNYSSLRFTKDRLFINGNESGITFSYDLPRNAPRNQLGAKSMPYWTGDGSGAISRFISTSYSVISNTTDGSGDLTITVPTMPDATYSTNITVEGTTSYTVSVHTKTTTSFKVRFFNPATGAAVASTSVSCSYKIEDY